MRLLTLFILANFYSLSSLSQSFMTRMTINEILEDTIIVDSTKILWVRDRQDNLVFIWNNKNLLLLKKPNHPNRLEKRQIRTIKRTFNISEEQKKYRNFFIHSLYYNKYNEMFFVTIYIREGILIWISRLDEKYPCYFMKF